MFWAVLLAVSVLSRGAFYVAPQQSVTSIWVRIGEAKEISTPPDYSFDNVYSKTVYMLDQNNNEVDFSEMCRESPADIAYQTTYRHSLDLISNHNKDIIYNFQDIKANKRILDVSLINNWAYLLLNQKGLLIFDITSLNNYLLPTIPTENKIESGFLVRVNEREMVIVTPKQVFGVDGGAIRKLTGFEELVDLQSARPLFDNYFIVCGIKSGLVIYTLEGDKVVKRHTLDSKFFQRSGIFISDVAFNPDRNELFVSDEKFGINIVKLNKGQPDINPRLTNDGYRKVGCNVILYSQGNLYAACDDLFKVQYSTDGKIIDIPNPLFKVKELLVHKGLLVAVGQDVITKYYNDKMTAKGPQLDHDQFLIFCPQNRFLRANYYGLSTGTYKLKSPSVVCSTKDPSMEGIRNGVIKTEAECSQKYFQQHGLDNVENQQRCVYTSPVQFNFWNGQTFDIEVVLVVMGVLFLVAAIITTWAIFIYTKEAYLRRTLMSYTAPSAVEMGSGTQVPGYNKLVEEKQIPGSQIIRSDSGVDISQTQKPMQIDMDHGTHSID